MKSGSLVVALVTVLLFLTSAPSPQTIRSVDSLVAVDATGKKVGNAFNLKRLRSPSPIGRSF